ncbi:SufB/SufD family protein [Pararhodobacter oceanensis]|uniref:SufB/SufD family protein n=1 Tax=Pararhodobacter oceanensis TaxID=2172121 RepID=UPI003A93AC18
MTTASAVSPRAARFAARLKDTEAHLSSVTLPESSAWLMRAREAAMERLKGMGMPEKRDEYWRYTDPARFVSSAPTPAEVFVADDEPVMFGGIERLSLVFVDGVFSPEQSDKIEGEGLEIERLSEAGQADIHWAKDLYGTLEAKAQNPVPRPLAALNTATATDGALIRVTGRVSRPVSLVYLRSDANAEMVLHHVVRVEEGGEVTLLENGPGAARVSTVLEADLADRATLHHVRAMGRDHQRAGCTHIFARQGAESHFRSFTLSVNGAMVRNEMVVWLEGEGGVVHLAGAAMGDGDFHNDDTIFVTHTAPACESRQVYKKVLYHGAVGVFQGKILVEQSAQLTDGYQKSQALLMDESGQFLAKPELEIHADDVKCSHGSTSGELDEDHLFYLRARGVPEDDAKRLLVTAFLGESLDEIEDHDLANDIRLRLAGWLERHGE